MSATPEQMIGKTVASVQMRDMAGRDTFKDTVTWTLVEITFTDGTQVSFADSDTEVYDAFEYKGFDADGDPIPLTEEGVLVDLSDSRAWCATLRHHRRQHPGHRGARHAHCETRTPAPKDEDGAAASPARLPDDEGLAARTRSAAPTPGHLMRSSDACTMVPEGVDTDGAEWFHCTTHGISVLG